MTSPPQGRITDYAVHTTPGMIHKPEQLARRLTSSLMRIKDGDQYNPILRPFMTLLNNMAGDKNAVHEPSVADVLVVKAILNKALSLPPELVHSIIDQAEYWPHTTTIATFDGVIEPPGTVGRHVGCEDKFLLRAPPLGLRVDKWKLAYGGKHPPLHRRPLRPQPLGEEYSTDDFQTLTAAPPPLLAHPCRRIVFTIKSCDQGWGGEARDHPYHNSWTWFEAGVERWCKPARDGSSQQTDATSTSQQPQLPSMAVEDLCTVLPRVERKQNADDAQGEEYVFVHPLHPNQDLMIQCNQTAQGEMKEHRVVWSYDDDVDPDDAEAADKLVRVGRGKATANGKFVRELRLGDVITVWGHARFPGWTNLVDSARIDVYYAV